MGNEVRAGQRVIRDERYVMPVATVTRRVFEGQLRVLMISNGGDFWATCRPCDGCADCTALVDHECEASMSATKEAGR